MCPDSDNGEEPQPGLTRVLKVGFVDRDGARRTCRCPDTFVTRRGLGHPVPITPAGHDRRLHGEAGRIHSPVEFSTPSPRTPLPNFYYYLFARLRLPHVPISGPGPEPGPGSGSGVRLRGE